MEMRNNLNRTEWTIEADLGFISIVDCGDYLSIKHGGMVITAPLSECKFIFNEFSESPEESILYFHISAHLVNASITIKQSEYEAIKQDPTLGKITVLNCE